MITELLSTASQGFGFHEVAIAGSRLAGGLFFAISGYHKLFNKTRHATLLATLKQCGVPFCGVMQWFVPSVEFFGGLAVIMGLFAPVAALGLIAICFVATCTDGIKRIKAWSPIDKADYVDDVLYLPEVIYILPLAIVVIGGPGSWAVSSLMF